MKCSFSYERRLKRKGYKILIGVDEAGRGSLAGPVVAAAIVLSKVTFKNRIDDSKRLTPQQRYKAFLEITQKSLYGLGILNEKIIDHYNIFVATRLAMERAIEQLLDRLTPANKRDIHILIDGNVRPAISLAYTNIIKGDSVSKTVACASIVAKVVRDRIMSMYDKVYPCYGFSRHKGYATVGHRDVLRRLGVCDIHRRSFCCV
ncbi:MAG: ribonuclease HII [Candidatus Omnitrophica bacterium]|nr:ribonuclease HII [Candidatus Omnitrophota bacterium]